MLTLALCIVVHPLAQFQKPLFVYPESSLLQRSCRCSSFCVNESQTKVIRVSRGRLDWTLLPISDIRRALSLIANVTDLELVVSISASPSMFSGVQLPQLIAFKTNVTYKFLALFLAQNHTIEHLSLLTSCRNTTSCPLATLDLPALTEVKCSYKCLLIHLLLLPSCLELFNPLLCAANVDILSTQRSFPPRYLSVLMLQILSDKYDVLQHVIMEVLNVNRLKLVEKPAISVRPL